MFPNRFHMLKLFGIAKFHQVSVDGSRNEFGTPYDSALRKFAETRNILTETMRKPYVFLSFTSAETLFFIQCMCRVFKSIVVGVISVLFW